MMFHIAVSAGTLMDDKISGGNFKKKQGYLAKPQKTSPKI